MLRFATVVCTAASVFPDDLSLSEGLHLLQLKGAKTTNSESYAGGEARPSQEELERLWNEKSRTAMPWSRYGFSKMNCHVRQSVQGYLSDKSTKLPKDMRFGGDPYQTVAGRCRPTGPGLYPVLTKKDGSEAVQMYNLGCSQGIYDMRLNSQALMEGSHPDRGKGGQNKPLEQACSAATSYAFKFDDVIVRVLPDWDRTPASAGGNRKNDWRLRVCCNQDPWNKCFWLEEFGPHRHAKPICGTDGPNQVAVYKPADSDYALLIRESSGFKTIFIPHQQEGFAAQYKDKSGKKRWSWHMEAQIKMIEPQLEGTLDICFENEDKWGSQYEKSTDVRYNDVGFKDFGTWHAHDNPATPFHESPLFTQEDHDMFCNKGFWDQGKSCDNTTLFYDPLPKSDQLCSKNNCPYSMAQGLCESTKSNQLDHEDCLFDYCETCDEEQAAQWAEWEKIEHPSPMCAEGMETCAPDTIAATATKMNMLHLVQNNLGGAGPDSGAEEIRYSHVTTLNGERVDLVITVDGEYTPRQASKGLSGSLGVINVACGTEALLNLKIVNSETGAPVVVDNVAISWYDIDEGKRGKGRSTVTSCGDGLITSSNSELAVRHLGSCWSATSSTPGTKADNPSAPFPLTELQRGRVATFVFSDVSSFTATLRVEGGRGGRNFLFAMDPGVAVKR